MMKKNGFTLAEVLITLAIIGVVATMTLPALMNNTAEQQYKTGLKKGINTLTEAANMNQAIDGFDYASITSADTSDQEEQSLFGLLAKRTSVDFGKSGTGALDSNGATSPDGNFTVFLRDGSAIMFNPEATLISVDSVKAMDNDGLVHGIAAIYDANGAKGPNILSNCKGEANGAEDDEGEEDEDLKDVCSPSNRVIKDQFGIRLRGGYAVPNGPAARWAYSN